jgi:hypothetical protein
MASAKCGKVKRLREIAEVIDEVFVDDNSGDELVVCVDESDSKWDDENVVSGARNNDATDTSRPTQFQQTATEDISEIDRHRSEGKITKL